MIQEVQVQPSRLSGFRFIVRLTLFYPFLLPIMQVHKCVHLTKLMEIVNFKLPKPLDA